MRDREITIALDCNLLRYLGLYIHIFNRDYEKTRKCELESTATCNCENRLNNFSSFVGTNFWTFSRFSGNLKFEAKGNVENVAPIFSRHKTLS